MENDGPDPRGQAPPPKGFLETADRWKQYLVAIAAILTVVAQLWGVVENQWRLAGVTLILAIVIVALYFVSHRVPIKSLRAAAWVRVGMILLLIAIPVCSIAGLVVYSFLPRLTEGDTTTIAVAEFDGPPLPDIYKNCRPSDMLVHTLAKVGARLGGVRAFELPYSIDPDNRWATSWAEFHGSFEAADMTVYGEYIPYESQKGAPNGQSDELVINPEVTRIPSIPLGFTSAPLYGWTFTGSVANIQELCGSDLPDAGFAPRFLDDARRIASAVAGLRALGRNDYEAAENAATEARRSEVEKPQPACAVNPAKKAEAATIEEKSLCPAVLAFYLATLDTRLGNLQAAIGEYAYAAPKLGTPAGYINLGELYMSVGDPKDAFKALDRAVGTDPTSVAAWATRSQYERDYMKPQQAWIDLQRAMKLRREHYQGPFDDLVLSFAIYQRGDTGNAHCGIDSLKKVLYPDWPVDPRPVKDAGVEALVRYGLWLKGAKDYPEAIADLHEALKHSPDDVQGNYALGISYEYETPSNPIEAETFLRRAEYARAYTDADYLYRANAANELATNFDQRDPTERSTDLARAKDAYDSSIKKNPGAVYAYYGRSIMEEPTDGRQALVDLQVATKLHPDDATIQSAMEQMLKSMGRTAESLPYRRQAAYVIQNRISKKEAKDWDVNSCGYKNPDE